MNFGTSCKETDETKDEVYSGMYCKSDPGAFRLNRNAIGSYGRDEVPYEDAIAEKRSRDEASETTFPGVDVECSCECAGKKSYDAAVEKQRTPKEEFRPCHFDEVSDRDGEQCGLDQRDVDAFVDDIEGQKMKLWTNVFHHISKERCNHKPGGNKNDHRERHGTLHFQNPRKATGSFEFAGLSSNDEVGMLHFDV